MTAKMASVLVSVLWLFGGAMGLGLGVSTAHSAHPAHPAQQCQEDDPCWDCTTMGNRICGSHSH